MNSFLDHHKDNIRWHYRCFDRILLNGLIQPFQQPERVVGFFNTYRQIYPVTRSTLRDIADQFQRWVTERAAKRNIPIVEAPKGRRDEFVDLYFRRAKPGAVAVILKAREPARIMIAIGDKAVGYQTVAERRGRYRASEAGRREPPSYVAGVEADDKTGTADDDPTLLDEVAA
jgi:hypothetical protein